MEEHHDPVQPTEAQETPSFEHGQQEEPAHEGDEGAGEHQPACDAAPQEPSELAGEGFEGDTAALQVPIPSASGDSREPVESAGQNLRASSGDGTTTAAQEASTSRPPSASLPPRHPSASAAGIISTSPRAGAAGNDSTSLLISLGSRRSGRPSSGIGTAAAADIHDAFVNVHGAGSGSGKRTSSAGMQQPAISSTAAGSGQQASSQPSSGHSQQQDQGDHAEGDSSSPGAGHATHSAPQHQWPTRVQPKPPLQSSEGVAATEHLRTVWSTGNCLGIRSLPDALSPDFRTRLYEELLETRRRERACSSARRPDMAYGLEGGPLSMPLSIGQKQVARVNPLSGMFTQYEYLPSEYERARLMGKFDRLRHRLCQVAPSEWVVRAPPGGPKGAPAFSEYEYTHEDYEGTLRASRADAEICRAKILAGPFYPSGSLQRAAWLKGRLDEAMMGLCKQLSSDWPSSFMQIFEDVSGGVVVSFDLTAAVSEGDLSSYMNQLAKANPHVLHYQLTKDATQWGLVDEVSQAVFYVMFPPWVRHKYLGSTSRPPLHTVSGDGDGGMDVQPSAGEMLRMSQGQGQGAGGGGRGSPGVHAARHVVHAQ